MKLFEQEHKYEHNWGLVTYAFWFKYPNDIQKHIKNIDVVNRFIDTKEKILKLKRIIHLQYYIPSFFKNIFHIDGKGLAIEEILINQKEKKLTINTTNYTLSPFIKITEECIYYQKGNDENHTHYKQTTALHMSGFGYMKNFIENTILNTIKEKSKQGINVMNDVIKRKIQENVSINNDSICLDKLQMNKDKKN